MSLPGFRSLLTVLESGFERAGFVMGAVAFQLMRPTSCMGSSRFGTEPLIYPDYEQAVRTAWRVAIDRLEGEAASRGAHGVVGVTATDEAVAGSPFLHQLQLVGSAVRVAHLQPLARPFLSMLPMDDTLKLLLRGWVPSGIAFGFSAVHVHGWAASALMQNTVLANAEMSSLTMGMQLARVRAEDEVRGSLQLSQSQGAVASTVSLQRLPQTCGGGQGALIEGRIVGTGVVRYREPAVAVSAARNLAGRRLS
jgi:uncharacterized protein YbjQ (UPF0145 family)